METDNGNVKFWVCSCGEQFRAPEKEDYEFRRAEVKEACEKSHCGGKYGDCRDCGFPSVASEWCDCNCNYCRIEETRLVPKDHLVKKNKTFTFVNKFRRLGSEAGWNVALGEYVETVNDVEKARKKKGLEYAGNKRAHTDAPDPNGPPCPEPHKKILD